MFKQFCSSDVGTKAFILSMFGVWFLVFFMSLYVEFNTSPPLEFGPVCITSPLEICEVK